MSPIFNSTCFTGVCLVILMVACGADPDDTGTTGNSDTQSPGNQDAVIQPDAASIARADTHTTSVDGGQKAPEIAVPSDVIAPSQAVESGLTDLKVAVSQKDNVAAGLTYIGVSLGESPKNAVGDRPYYLGINSQGIPTWSYIDKAAKATNNRMVKRWPNERLLAAFKNEYRVLTTAGETVSTFKGDTQAGMQLHHDAAPLPNGNILALVYETRTIDVPFSDVQEKVRGDRLIERTPAGESIWSWSTFDHIDTQRFPGKLSKKKGKNGSYDWTHANAVTYRNDDNTILVSLRHQNHVVKINRETSKVVWRLGDGGDFELLGTGQWFYSQHSPEWLDNSQMLLYDNGNERPGDLPRYSRAVIYKLDETNMTATQTWEYKTEFYTEFLGGVQMLSNGNVLVCAGGHNAKTANQSGPPVPGQAQVIEVTPTTPAQTVWELSVTGFIYRAYRHNLTDK